MPSSVRNACLPQDEMSATGRPSSRKNSHFTRPSGDVAHTTADFVGASAAVAPAAANAAARVVAHIVLICTAFLSHRYLFHSKDEIKALQMHCRMILERADGL